MFDWEDEELSNMIWSDNGETGDHIVPFKVRSEQLDKKEQGEESKTIKPAEQKITAAKSDLHGSKPGSSSGCKVDEGIPQPEFCIGSWLDSSSLSNCREADQDSSAAELSKCLLEKTSELGKGPDIFHSTGESKEQGDFDEYGWANIGSFDDLDRMFSNDVPIFGDGSLSSTDELWSNSIDVFNSPSKSLPSILDSQDLGLEIRPEFEQQEKQQFPLIGKANGLSSQSVPSVSVSPKAEKYCDHKDQPSVEDQPYQQNKMMKFSKMSGTSEEGAFQMYGQKTPSRNFPGKFVNQLAQSRSSLMAVSLQSESQGSGTSHYPHIPNQSIATSSFGSPTNPYSNVPVLSAVQCPDVKNQLIHPSYIPTTNISVNMTTNASARPSTMTPQEKLEKLRRRQQMQAMLAIQRQQQQLRHVVDQSITQNYRQDNPVQLVDKTNLQRLAAVPSFDPKSSLELNDSGIDNSAESSVLYRLQDVVAKLDMGTRTCIRDSLFRLAGSAGQRHHTSDTAQSKKTSQGHREVIPNEESRYKHFGIPDTETVTNPTDRVVAHLLFHRPIDTWRVKHMEGSESPASSKMGTEEKGKSPECRTREIRINKKKANEEEAPASSLALGNAPNSGSSSTVGERVVETSQGNKRKL